VVTVEAVSAESNERGYVIHIASGATVCKMKYGGKMDFWSVENWARGRAR
jgi:hypothetical protein